MRKARNIIIALLALGLLVGGGFFAIGQLSPKKAGINIETTPQATVFINGEQVGRTPYRATRDSGEVVIKLVPESFENPLAPYETNVNLVSGIETIIKRQFGQTEENSSGVIVSFQRVGGDESSIAVISIPDSAEVSIDGQVRGFTPIKESKVVPGDHTISVSAPGYKEETVSVKAVEGYKLTAEFKLSPNGEEIPDEEPEEEEPVIDQVEILETPTGFLRVRGGPSTAFEEVGRVEPGERYTYLETDEDTGWFMIELGDGEEGWVTNEYAERVTSESSPSPSPSPTE